MTRVLLLTLLIAACSGDGSTGVTPPPPPPPPPPPTFVLFVNGTQTQNPGPYCTVSVGSPASLNLRSRPGVRDSVVATLGAGPSRRPLIWSSDVYDAGGYWVTTLYSQPNDSTSVPGSISFAC